MGTPATFRIAKLPRHLVPEGAGHAAAPGYGTWFSRGAARVDCDWFLTERVYNQKYFRIRIRTI